jgi:peptidoglycan hydrolase-like protein with peptidoglycan-binding domain
MEAGDMGRSGVKVGAGAVGVALVAGGAWLVMAGRGAGDTGTPQVTGVATATAEVRRVEVAERQQVYGTLGYAGTYNVIAPGPGTLTRLPSVGAVVRRGQALYEIDGKPVVLMYGQRPAWRPLQLGMTNGTDVQQLETNLKKLGYGAGLTVDQHFTSATSAAVRRWQRAAKLAVTGSVPLGQVVFMPDAVRISAADRKLGEQVQPGAVVEHGTSTRPAITIQLSTQQLPNVKVGDRVVVTLPDGETRGGKFTQVGAVATSSSGSGDNGNSNGGGNSSQSTPSEPTVPATVQADGTISGFLDQAQVGVAITLRSHPDVLAVPITALNARPGGEYEVIVVDGTTTRRVPVETGLFDEVAGLAEVNGQGLAEGQKVRVPDDEA